ncbi:MAG TPA: hypothetical protein PK052_01705 [Anaerohalosphaeraceae bacterium]|nr:hypothetical protein [Anaerohalosphaeraceae bacterium]HOL30672.1 hypothetical protein [Anaerohalosphaeraceae bacterium]HOM76476.1 hypothetical protein [Anaerohalosphaeraceae bacterium]HPC63404.1 hypothetical protein [Anaerohalosphaeraceae bacterium]HPO70557.1 hypothetical protein [Anaerohalosphaeraceae bacterium]
MIILLGLRLVKDKKGLRINIFLPACQLWKQKRPKQYGSIRVVQAAGRRRIAFGRRFLYNTEYGCLYDASEGLL